MKNIFDAFMFAAHAHKDQRRKYTGEPYINHCIHVAQILQEAKPTEEMTIAAILHDTVEDTNTTIQDIENNFGMVVACFVEQLTDSSKKTDGNRKVRKQIDLEHTDKVSPSAKTIKLADLISNSESIAEHDYNFAFVYLKEKERLLDVLTEGDSRLYKRAWDTLIQSKLKLQGDPDAK